MQLSLHLNSDMRAQQPKERRKIHNYNDNPYFHQAGSGSKHNERHQKWRKTQQLDGVKHIGK